MFSVVTTATPLWSTRCNCVEIISLYYTGPGRSEKTSTKLYRYVYKRQSVYSLKSLYSRFYLDRWTKQNGCQTLSSMNSLHTSMCKGCQCLCPLTTVPMNLNSRNSFFFLVLSTSFIHDLRDLQRFLYLCLTALSNYFYFF